MNKEKYDEKVGSLLAALKKAVLDKTAVAIQVFDYTNAVYRGV